MLYLYSILNDSYDNIMLIYYSTVIVKPSNITFDFKYTSLSYSFFRIS